MIVEHEASLHAPPAGKVDMLIGAVGYESRSTWLLEQSLIDASSTVGLQFEYNQELHFERACEIYSSAGAQLVTFKGEEDLSILTSKLLGVQDVQNRPARVVIDISAMSRHMIASVLLALTRCCGPHGIEITAHYTPATYSPPGPTAPARVAQPIIPELAGWSSRPEAPLGVIVGLGYEGSAAAGALQVLEPSRTWALHPVGFDERFLEAVDEANTDLSVLYDVIRLTYSVSEPAATRALLRRMLSDLRADYRMALIPFGPKIFSWLCMVTALENGFEEVAVWRFSPQELGSAVDHVASGLSVWHQFFLPGAIAVGETVDAPVD